MTEITADFEGRERRARASYQRLLDERNEARTVAEGAIKLLAQELREVRGRLDALEKAADKWTPAEKAALPMFFDNGETDSGGPTG